MTVHVGKLWRTGTNCGERGKEAPNVPVLDSVRIIRMMRSKTRVAAALALVTLAITLRAAMPIIEGKYNRVRTQPPYKLSSETVEFQRRLFVADLHADSLLWGRNLLKRS